jgi:predicted acetyltransferase
MDLDVRLTRPDELRAAADAARHGLLFPATGDTDWARWGHGWVDGHVSVSTWDGDACVGHAGSLSMPTRVVGGAWLPTAAISRVGVRPTHTRRGALTRMMHLLLQEERRNGNVLSSLRASEAVIYGRFGYGLAGSAIGVSVDPLRVRPIQGAAPGSFRSVTPAEVGDVIPALYSRLDHRVGALMRSPFMWERIHDEFVTGGKPEYVVVHTSPDGVDDGYVRYTAKWTEDRFPDNSGQVAVEELFGDTPAVELALWSYLCNLSLVREIKADGRPEDDALRLAIGDVRGYASQSRWDEQWVRLLDVEAALAGRTYDGDDSVTIAVTDPWFPDNADTFRVSASGVERVNGEADLTAPIAELSAAYMGTVRWADLVAVGRVQANWADAAPRADRLFGHRPGTWCGTFF